MAAPMKATVLFGAQGADQVAAAASRVNHDLEKVSKSAGRLNGAFRGMRGGAAQLGYQIQDVAVQLQAGQNALLVFGQQGSQIASLMGPGGALIGAVIAVGAAVGTALVPSLFKAEEQMFDLAEAVEKLKEEQRELSQAARAVLISDQEKKIEALEGQLNAATDALAKNTRETQNNQAAVDFLTSDMALMVPMAAQGAALQLALSRSAEEVTDSTNRETLSVEELNKRLNEARAELDALTKGENPFVEADKDADRAREKVESFIETLKEQAATYGASATEIMRYQIGLMDLTEEQIAQAELYIQLIEEQTEAEKALKAEELARKKIEREAGGILDTLQTSGMSEVERIRHEQQEKLDVLNEYYAEIEGAEAAHAAARQKINEDADRAIRASQEVAMMGAISFIQNQLSFLQQAVGESSAAGKALFAINQGLAIANAIVSTEAGAAKALEMGPPMGPILSGVIRALGYASVGAIAAQTVAGFEGGGITFNGVRSGGLDGKGGRMAMVHPNEKITDLEKDGMASPPVNISFNISAVDAKGIDQLLVQRRSLITNLVNKAINNRGRSSLA